MGVGHRVFLPECAQEEELRRDVSAQGAGELVSKD
jgi:hypothetical protein